MPCGNFAEVVRCCYCNNKMKKLTPTATPLKNEVQAECTFCGVKLSYAREHWDLLVEEETIRQYAR